VAVVFAAAIAALSLTACGGDDAAVEPASDQGAPQAYSPRAEDPVETPKDADTGAEPGAPADFDIVGQWKTVGEGSFGQAQSGAIIVFDGAHANLYSPNDTYALYEEGGALKLSVTGLLGGTTTFTVDASDPDNIILNGPSTVELKRVG
jgi:hypothetical protein